jgi:glycosyltransferase involved in cell wall biosynthesis
MVAYFFPPLGGAGVQRTLKFAKYLPDAGWDPTVITVNARDYWMADDSLAAELGERVRVVRTASVTGLGMLKRMAPRHAGRPGAPRRSAAGLRRLRTLASWFLVPDAYVGWIPYAEAAGKRLLREMPFDLIYTTSSPDSAHLVGRALAREFHLPWVADFRDPWTRRLSYRPPTRWHDARQRKLERAVLEEASQITVTAEATRDDFQARNPQITAGKVAVVTNGYDEDDFAPWADLHPAPDQMQILHAGQLNPERPAEPFLHRRRTAAQPPAPAHGTGQRSRGTHPAGKDLRVPAQPETRSRTLAQGCRLGSHLAPSGRQLLPHRG